MGYTYASQIVHMIFIILFTFIVTISLQNSSHNFIAHSFHGLQKQFYFMEEATVGNEEEREALFVQKFRALLGLNGFKGKSPSFVPICASPAPAPSPFTTAEPPAAAPAPAPVPPKHTKSRSSPPRPIHFAPHHGVQKEHKDRGRVRRALVLTLVSAGVFFVAFLLGFACLCGRIRKQRKKSVKPLWVYGKRGKARGKSKYLSSHSSSSKASLNPSIDVRYLEALAVDLEQQEICFKPNPEILNSASSNEVLKPESDNASSSSTKEIVSVHDGEANSVKYESNGGNSLSSDEDEIIPVDCHSSDNDSFHSCANSHSSNLRLSDASAGSICDITAEVTQNPPTMTLYSPLPSSLYHFAPPPPPPPPPLPPPLPQKLHILPPKSSPVKLKSKDSSSPTLSDSALETNPCVSRRGKQNQSEASVLQAFPEKTAKSAEGPSPIPPPPSPPTFLKAKLTSSSTAVKEPPPPPCQLPQYTPLGKNGAPLPKLKPLHWDKVRAAPDRTMVWDKLRSSSFELDEEMIESLFGYNIQGSVKNDEAKSKTPSPTKHVLEPKRLQNMTILLKALNMTPEQACNALMKGNGLGLQQLEALVKLVPTKEEEAKLSEYKGDINELGSAEKFIKALLCIPFAFLRVEAMLYRETFEDEVVHLKNSFSMLEEACKELRSSKLFLKLLEAVLKTGNRMNVGTIRGGARAFKLDALLKLSDVKGTDGKTTLLHFVVQEIIRSEGMRVSDSIMGKINQKNNNRTVEEREEDYRSMGLDLVSGLSSELYHVKKTATLDLDALASSVSNLSDGMTKLHWLVTNKLSGDEKSRSFISSMNSFINYAERNLKELKEDEDRVLLHVREITEYFHGDLSKEEANPLRIFVIVRDFLGMLDHICKELKSLKIPSSPSPLAPFR